MEQSIKRTKLEMARLLQDNYWRTTNLESGKFDWDVILDFSIESAQDLIMKKAPVIWMLLTPIALGFQMLT